MRHNMTKKQNFNIKLEIETNREIINSLLVLRAKHVDDLYWVKTALMHESIILHQCPSDQIRSEINTESITNICDTWTEICKKTNITNFTLSDVIDLHRSLATNAGVIPGDLRTSAAYSEQLQIQLPELANQEVMRQKINNAIYRLNSGKQTILLRAFDIHYELIEMQAFTDFNKRTARMLMNWFLITKGYRPIIFNEQSDHDNYMLALRKCAHGDKKFYYNYMYNKMLHSQQSFIKMLQPQKR